MLSVSLHRIDVLGDQALQSPAERRNAAFYADPRAREGGDAEGASAREKKMIDLENVCVDNVRK